MVDDVRKKMTRQYVAQVRSIVKKVYPAYHRVNSLTFIRLIRDKWLWPLEKKKDDLERADPISGLCLSSWAFDGGEAERLEP